MREGEIPLFSQIIGAGPAGYEAAIRAAQLGKKVACVDKDRNGGTCNNWGCIPTKALLKKAELYHDMKDRAGEFGFELDGEDIEVSQALEKSFAKQGIQLLTNHKTTKTEANDGGVRITVADPKGAERTLEAEIALVAIGVSPVLPGGSLKIGLDEKGFVKVSDRYETTVAGVFAAGDIIGPPWLAHVASFEAIQTVEGLFLPGHQPKKVTVFPGCTYCHPQVASVGLSERAAKEKGLKYKVGKMPFIASGKARAIGENEGFVKVIVGEPHGEILGAHIIGSDATEMIAELGLAITAELTYEEIAATIHAHPTLSEAVFEAIHAAHGTAIHL